MIKTLDQPTISNHGPWLGEGVDFWTVLSQAKPVAVTDSNTTTIHVQLNDPEPPLAQIEQSGTALVNVDPSSGKLDIQVPRAENSRTDLIITRVVTCPQGSELKKVQLKLSDYITTMLQVNSSTTYKGAIPAGRIVSGEIEVIVVCGEQVVTQKVADVRLLDPSGDITDAITGDPVVGAQVDLFKLNGWKPKNGATDTTDKTCHTPDTKGKERKWTDFPPAPQNDGVRANPNANPQEIDPKQNPLFTNDTGRYAWNVAENQCWYVVVQKEGYQTRVSPPVGVPPEVTDLDLTLMPELVQFGTLFQVVQEPQQGSMVQTVVVSLTTAMNEPVTVDYAITGGTATKDKDYTFASSTLTFAPGEVQKTVSITINSDGMDEDDEPLIISLKNPSSNIRIREGYGSATITIKDSDEPPVVSFGNATYRVNEQDKTIPITIKLSNPSAKTVSVAVSSIDGTAQASKDYLALKNTITFAPGETDKTFMLTVIDNATADGNKTMTFNLSNPINAVLKDPSQATVTIVDDEKPTTPVTPSPSTTTTTATPLPSTTVTTTVTAVTTVTPPSETTTPVTTITPTPKPGEPTDVITAPVSPSIGGIVKSSDNRVQVEIPPDAVQTNATAILSTLADSAHPMPANSKKLRVFRVEVQTSDGTKITQFFKPLVITLTYTDEELQALGINEENLSVAFWNGTVWEEITASAACPQCGITVDKAKNVVTITVDHLTEFALIGKTTTTNATQKLLYLPIVQR